MRYRSRPSEIEAIQWTGDNLLDVEEFDAPVAEMFDPVWGEPNDQSTVLIVRSEPNGQIELLAGKGGAQDWVPVPVGHWIVRQPGDLTDHWPIDPDYFEKKYEAVDDE